MKIKVYNKTGYDSKPFKKVMEVAHNRLGLKGCVVVKLTRGGDWLSRGVAHQGRPYMWSLASKPIKSAAKRYKIEKDSGYGWVTIALPKCVGRGGKQEIDHAEWIYELIFHELAHIKDYRNGAFYTSPMINGKTVRRPSWKKRPCEIKAENLSYDAEQKVAKSQKEKLVWGMALEIERVNKEYGRKRFDKAWGKTSGFTFQTTLL